MSKKEIFLIIILIIISLVRFFYFIPEIPQYKDILGNSIVFEGFVIDEPDIRLLNKQLKVKIINQDVNILVIADRNSSVSYGDKIKVEGYLLEPENFTTSSGKEFNYKRYLSLQDIYYIVKDPQINVISHNNGNKIKSILYKFRNRFTDKINKIIPKPESDLANGLILGIRGGFDKEMNEKFISTGTIHIIALSGYNVSIIAEGVMRIFGLVFTQVISIIFGIVIIILFIVMTGANATAIRAGIMAVIMLIGRMTDRRYLAGRALVIAGLLMISYNPRVILDMSFQLSFIATGGVLFLTPKVINWVRFISPRFGFREMFASTIAATIAVLPILLYLTGVLSLVSLFANILILLFIPIAMLFIFMTGLFGFIFHPIAILLGYIAYLILAYILYVISFFGGVAFASIIIQSFPLSITIILYTLMIWWFLKRKTIS